MSTITRHYEHGRIELVDGKWFVYIETNESDEYEFVDWSYDLGQAEELYFSWWEA